MNTAKLKRYAPAARRQFREAVRSRAAKIGLTEGKVAPVTVSGDVALLEGSAEPRPRAFADQRRSLEEKINASGFDAVVEEAAYTWFNRLAAIRYMELHGYLDHGYRVLSHPDGKPVPQALEEAPKVDLPGLDRAQVVGLRLDGTKDEELYRMLLLAQCRALHEAMPFLFEPIDDATELLLPDNLLARDSVVGTMVAEVDESDWEQIEILGWLYQFYIWEEKARIDADVKKGKSVKASEIPAKTQIFTPNWIVKYMVQNSLGRLWFDIEPTSAIKERDGWEYWVPPALQEPEVEQELSLLAAEARAAHPSPESITFLDPCAGSGHILVEAYDVFKAIYAERGYARREIPRLILERNLFGLEIDPRAAQIAGFALLMKARADDRTIVKNPPTLNVMAVQGSEGINIEEIVASFPTFRDARTLRKAVEAVHDLFTHADIFGSLIRPSAYDMAAVAILQEAIASCEDGTPANDALKRLRVLVDQAEALSRRYDVAVTNPPYLDIGKVGEPLKGFVARQYTNSKADLYGAFMERCSTLATGGYAALINIPNWMFLSSFERLRDHITTHQTIDSLVHIGRGVFGADFGTVAFVLRDHQLVSYKGAFRRLFEKQGSVSTNEELRSRFVKAKSYFVSDAQFREIPGAPIAYWVGDNVRRLFREGRPLGQFVDARNGMTTGDNGRFLRFWWEVAASKIVRFCRDRDEASDSGKRWFPFNKGGEFRRWYGNQDYVVDWEGDGRRLFENRPKTIIRNPNYYFKRCITWSHITAAASSFRLQPEGTVFGNKGQSAFPSSPELEGLCLAFCNSNLVTALVPALNPGIGLEVGDFLNFPLPPNVLNEAKVITSLVDDLVQTAKADWDDREGSMDYREHPILRHAGTTLQGSLDLWKVEAQERVSQTLNLESDINRRFIDAADLGNELNANSTEATCVWLRPDAVLLAQSFVSYGIGVLMGRWAHKAGEVDDDGILPVTEDPWFGDEDTAERLAEFVGRVWPREGLHKNLALLVSGLGAGEDVPPRDALRRYLATDFYSDHLRQYRKRPIYWLFSSGKRRAFGALVYLHSYNAGTLSRMRVNYVVPLQQRMAARLEQLGLDIEASATTAERRRRTKERDALQGQLDELRDFDERLRHVAGQQIELDLDDGVKTNYAKFGDLLAESRAIVGDADE